MFWHRSTKDIVISRKRKREERAEWIAAHPNSEADHPTAVPGTPEETKEEIRMEEIKLEHPTLKNLNTKKLCIAAGSIASAVLLFVLLLVLPNKNTPTPYGVNMDVPSEMTVVAMQDTALASSLSAGDIVQIYASDGTIIQQLQYVQVCGITEENSLLLAMEPMQVAAFIQHNSVTAALVTRSKDRAAELLDLQSKILHPSVQLKLPYNLTLKPGESWIPELSISMDPVEGIIPEIVWTSSDMDICSYTDGLIYAGNLGKASITVSCGNATASCTVDVRIPLTAIQLSHTSLSLATGDSAQLTATPEPQDATDFKTVWSSDNPAVATVAEDGTITAVGTGTATISVSCGEISVSCTVKVGVHTELVQFSKHEVSMTIDDTLALEYAISPAENNLDTVSFTSSNSKIVSVTEDGTIKALTAGQATITITSGNATDTLTVKVSSKPAKTGGDTGTD